MTEEEIRDYLSDNGYPEYLVQRGGPGLVVRWKDFVSEVEKGYKRGLEDYRNDLDLRGIIALVGLDAEVQDADTRLEAMLIARDQRVWESGDGNPFWDFGFPKNASGYLLKGLQEEGLVEF
jgi:hypothetical protein